MLKTARTILCPLLKYFAVTVAVFAPLAVSVSAAAAAGGIEVMPVRNDITLSSGDHTTITIKVTNLYGQTYAIQNGVYDIITQADGTEKILLNGQNAPSHSLRNFRTANSRVFVGTWGFKKGLSHRRDTAEPAKWHLLCRYLFPA